MTDLSTEQESAIESIGKWLQDCQNGGNKQVFTLFGPAGTGKTTLARSLEERVQARFMAYTGKAAHVLQRKGVPARTIHSTIYQPTADQEAKEKLEGARQELLDTRSSLADMPGEAVTIQKRIVELEAEIATLAQQARRLSWEWNPYAFADDQPELIVLDEVSMVNSKLGEDIEGYGIPVLVLGDPAQLPPVEGGGHYINRQPDIMLEHVHRQALESPVLELATRIRLSQDGRLGLRRDDTVPAILSEAMEADQIIVWSNKRRWSIISAIRNRLELPPGTPAPGDRIMCLSNNRDLGVFNGAQFTVLKSAPAAAGPTLTVRDDDERERTIPVFADGFQGLDLERQAKSSGAGIRGGRMLATFSQAITCHKAQGSEWGHVYVTNELDSMVAMVSRREGQAAAEGQARRWLYTAASRASDRLTITAPPRGRS